jgi:type III secretion protein L
MLADDPIALDDLPAEPGIRIVRAAQAKAWQDGYTFLATVRETAFKVDESARSTFAAAYEEGYAEGRDAGAFEASRLVRDTALAVDRYLAKLESEIGALAISVVQRIVGELDVTDLVARAANQALTEFGRERKLKVTVHPTAVGRLRTTLDAGRLAVTIESDPALDEAACIVASDFAVIDASIDVQLRALAAKLASASGT